jgi:membrane protein DedA with SNARE-associated domain
MSAGFEPGASQSGAEAVQPPPWARVGAIVVAIAVTLLIAALADRIEELKALGYLGAFLIMLLGNATVILPVPGLIFVFVMGGALNPLLLGLCAGPGAALGELTGYLVGFGGVAPVQDSAIYRRFDCWMDRFGPLVIFVLAVIPNPFFDMGGLLAGASEMPIWQFLLAAWLGKTVQAVLIALAGRYGVNWVRDLL